MDPYEENVFKEQYGSPDTLPSVEMQLRDKIIKYKAELKEKNRKIKYLAKQLTEKEDIIRNLLSILERYHSPDIPLPERPLRSISDDSYGQYGRVMSSNYVSSAVAHNQKLESKVQDLTQKNKMLKQKLKEQKNRLDEVDILRQILSVDEQIERNQQEEIKGLQEVASRQQKENFALQRQHSHDGVINGEANSGVKRPSPAKRLLKQRSIKVIEEVHNILDQR
eukprot:CAMPEP_0185021260 /NCGR_PEP_ID=MMETSP1103-20130426/3947_1 /TAXON_ID=36769 /ORGANISM="Paraphysomonas bandaiensis, Strain Caron Lab Isolate" /LENGTH=222 /DNA_ID=CAMNT_0027552681 /DNA_START=117 /DNA_END=782 /DNA_ORIENTATION=-